jgi:endonuclease YncB( thermonuclease family)
MQMKAFRKYLLSFIAIILTINLSGTPSYAAQENSYVGQTIDVSDGDTITVKSEKYGVVKIRLYGVDCPEAFQVHGENAKQYTIAKSLHKRVRITPIDIDDYGRTVAVVMVNGENLNEKIIAGGNGWVFRKYCHSEFCESWLKIEELARNSRLGLWQHKNPIPPWEWREQERKRGNEGSTPAVTKTHENPAWSSKGANAITEIYHGNGRSNVFHAPGCIDYNCRNCTVILKSKNEASSSGYRPHKACVK